MSRPATLNGDILTATCKACKCCLGADSHCWNCHTTMSVKELCDCGLCPSMLDDYVQREKMREQRKNGGLVN